MEIKFKADTPDRIGNARPSGPEELSVEIVDGREQVQKQCTGTNGARLQWEDQEPKKQD